MFKRPVKVKHYFLKEINTVVKLLIASDIVLIGSYGLLTPVFALFVEDFVRGGNATVAGVAAGIYLFTKSAFQIPVAVLLDKIKGEKDDFYFLFFGSIAMSLIPLSYLFVYEPWHLYLAQFALGIFTALTFPSFMAMFTRHIDSKKEGTEWGVYYTLTDLASASLSAVGGYLASVYGFHWLIIAMVTLSVSGSLMLWLIKPYLRLKPN